jgi:hypothetical protein
MAFSAREIEESEPEHRCGKETRSCEPDFPNTTTAILANYVLNG